MPGQQERAAAALDRARQLADGELFPAATATDRAVLLPEHNLALLAEAGLFGAAGPVEHGGLDLPRAAFLELVEVLAGGCLTTTLVWIQHHGAVRALAATDDDGLREEWLGALCRGARRAGVVFAGLVPGPARLTATPAGDGGWSLDGTADWVSGWGRAHVLLVHARGPDDDVVTLLVDAVAHDGLDVEHLDMVAAGASGTVRLLLDGVAVPPGRLVARQPFVPGATSTGAALRGNGSLALGVAGRAARLLGPGPVHARIDAARERLDAADDATMPAARAAAAALALQATHALVADAGARSVLRDADPQRLAREALLLEVFASRPPIRTALLAELGQPSDAA